MGRALRLVWLLAFRVIRDFSSGSTRFVNPTTCPWVNVIEDSSYLTSSATGKIVSSTSP